jgi:hypothetical protein
MKIEWINTHSKTREGYNKKEKFTLISLKNAKTKILNKIFASKIQHIKRSNRRDPRWQLECRSRQHELCKSKILLKCWSYTWQKKSTKKNQNFNTLNLQPVQSFSTSHYIEKTGGLQHHQMLDPYLLWRHLTGQQVSTKCHAVFPQPPLG